jgi:hypothetical protein
MLSFQCEIVHSGAEVGRQLHHSDIYDGEKPPVRQAHLKKGKLSSGVCSEALDKDKSLLGIVHFYVLY